MQCPYCSTTSAGKHSGECPLYQSSPSNNFARVEWREPNTCEECKQGHEIIMKQAKRVSDLKQRIEALERSLNTHKYVIAKKYDRVEEQAQRIEALERKLIMKANEISVLRDKVEEWENWYAELEDFPGPSGPESL